MNPVDAPMTYAIGDLHGEVTLLKKLLASLPLRAQDTLVFLGDYMDRGEDSIATVFALIELQRKHPHCIFIRGNHDDAWLDKWDGVHFQGPSDIDGALDVWDDCDGQLPFAVGDWLEQTRIAYEDTHAYYVHSGLQPGKSLQKTPDFAKMWGARGFLESTYNWGKPVVFGHHVFSEPLLQPNKIGVDTGAYKSGVLTAVRLPDRSLFQTRWE